MRRACLAFCSAALLSVTTNARAQPPPAPAPAPTATADPAHPAPSAPPAPPPAGISREDRAALASRVVLLERGSKPLGLGVILNGDGRIAASLAVLGDGRHLDARYADNSVVPVRIGHAERAHDLALLVPQNAKHRLGLKASLMPAPSLHAPLGSFASAGSKLVPGPTFTPTGPSAVLGNDGKPYPEAIAFTTTVPGASAGSPLIDANGEVVALVTRACKKTPGAACTPVLVGTPVGVVRDFLRGAPKGATLPTPTLGFQGVAEDTGTVRGIRVGAVRGPATANGLRAGVDGRTADVVVAVDGVPVPTPDALDRALEDRAVGDVADVLVFGAGRYRHVTLLISAAPR